MSYITFKNSNKKIKVGNIFCLGLNYQNHISEMGNKKPDEPIVFTKPDTAIINNNETILIPEISNNAHYEVEMIAVIGKNGKFIKKETALDYLIGYGVGIDVTLRDYQQKAKLIGGPWAVCKGFDTSAPISDIVEADSIPDPDNLNLKLWLNGELKQSGNTSKMIFKLDEIIEYLSKIFTLNAGDIIFTGTPEGVGQISDGDIIKASLGELVTINCNVK